MLPIPESEQPSYPHENIENMDDNYLEQYIQGEFYDKQGEQLEFEEQEKWRQAADTVVFMTKEHITGHEETKPDREGSSQSHPLFKAKVNGIDSTIFLDYGSNSSWVCESRTVPSNTFTSS